MNEESLVHHQGLKCPECGKPIIINWPRAEAMTQKQFQKRVKQMMKKEEG